MSIIKIISGVIIVIFILLLLVWLQYKGKRKHVKRPPLKYLYSPYRHKERGE